MTDVESPRAPVSGSRGGDNDYFIDPGEDFDMRCRCEIRHNFHTHPLMQLDKLYELADYLYEREQCRFVDPSITHNSDFYHTASPRDGRNLKELFENMEQPKSWIALYNVEAHPEYKAFLDEVIDCVRGEVVRQQQRIFNTGGFIFISAPPSITPFHIDRENNFWLQIRGRKTMTVFDHLDRAVVPESAVEQFIVNRSLDDVSLKNELRDRGRDFVVGPGDGVYFPATSPHMTSTTTDWVKPGDGVSISIGVVFYTEYTRYQAQNYQCNAVLRRMGFNPAFNARENWQNTFKSHVGHWIASVKKRYRGYHPPPGAY